MCSLETFAAPIEGDPDKRFEAVKFLGRGGFGFVELCKDLDNNNKLVVRKIAKVVATTEAEIITLYRSSHKNIIKFHGYYKKIVDQALIDREKEAIMQMQIEDGKDKKCTMKLNDNVYCLIIEFGQCGDLGKYIYQRDSMEEIILLKFLTQMIQAIQFLNQNYHMHRDIKPENILLDKYLNAKLADFGTTTEIDRYETHRAFTYTQGTGKYTAPEMYYHLNYDDKYNYLVDIFSLGVVMYEACNGKLDENIVGNIKDQKPKNISSEYYTAQFNDLIMKMVYIDPKGRISAANILETVNQFVTPAQLSKEDQNDFVAALNLFNGIDGIVNKKKAIQTFIDICKKTDFECPEPVYQLAKCYLYGDGIKKDVQKAIHLLRLSSRKQHVPSLKIFALCYKCGIGVEQDLFSGMQLLTIAQKTDPEVNFLLGRDYYDAKHEDINIKKDSKVACIRDYELAFYYFSQLKNYPPAQNYIGLCYLHGYGTRKDYLEAYKFLSLSAEGGYIDGMFNLAEYYLSQNANDEFYTKKAIELLTEAANQYHMSAAFRLSEIYSKGTIVQKDEKKASYYSKMNSTGPNEYDSEYSIALFKMQGRKEIEKNAHEVFTRFTTISENHPGAMYQLGKFYNNGIGTSKDCGEASDLFEKASDKGIIDATSDFALCLLRENGRPKNTEKAIELLTQSSELGCRYATYLLAQCYLNGEGVQKDEAQAIKLLRISHSQGYTDATYLLAHCIRNMIGISPEDFSAKTLEESRKLFKIAVEKGHALASYELGTIFNQNNELFVYKQKAFQLFEVAANQNYPQALTELGIFYELGNSVTKDQQKAFKLYQKAVNLGDIKGLYHLGMCYIEGIGVEPNYEKGRNLLEEVTSENKSDNKNANNTKETYEAKYQLGKLYLNGIGGSKDEVAGVKLIEDAANNGNTEAQVLFGKCLLKGIGTQINLAKARKYFKDAKDKNSAEAAYQLGLIYMNGIGIRPNKVDAILILNDLVGRNYAPAMFVLGKHYVENGENELEVSLGVELLKRAIAGGNSEALHYMGVCYLNGKGVSKNIDKALKHLYEAIAAGNYYAKTNLALCYIDGLAYPSLPIDEAKGYNILLEAPKDDIAARFRIGVCLYKGIGVQENKEEGLELIKETAELKEMNAMCYYGKILLKEGNVAEGYKKLLDASKEGQPEALYQVGLILEKGLNEIEKDELRAYGNLKRSSDAGFTKASYHLGKIYINIPERKAEGIELLEKAAKLRHPEAAKELERIYREGDGIEADESKASDYNKMANDPNFGNVPLSMLASTRNNENERRTPPPKKKKQKNNIFGGIKTLMKKKLNI